MKFYLYLTTVMFDNEVKNMFQIIHFYIINELQGTERKTLETNHTLSLD